MPVLHQAPVAYYVRTFRNCHWDDMRSCLSTAPWSVMEIFNDITDL